MAKIFITMPVTIEVEAELGPFGQIKIKEASWPNAAAIEQDILKLSTIKQSLIRRRLRELKG